MENLNFLDSVPFSVLFELASVLFEKIIWRHWVEVPTKDRRIMNPSLGATLRLFSHMNTLTRHRGKLSRVSSFHHSGQSRENSSFLHSCKWRKVSALNYNHHGCQLRKLSSSHRSQVWKVSSSHSVQSSKSFSRKFSGQNEDRDEESSPTVSRKFEFGLCVIVTW